MVKCNFTLGAACVADIYRGMIIACRRFAAALLLLSGLFLTPAVHAAVNVYFYSREFGNQFPHAFIIVKGTLDATGEVVSANYGFTAASVTPTVLMGSVKGYVQALKPAYIAKADRKFTVTLNDAGYGKLMVKVAEWQNRKQPAYNLNKANCVHFVMELAEVAGLKVNRASKFFKKPRSFLEEVQGLNPGVK